MQFFVQDKRGFLFPIPADRSHQVGELHGQKFE